MEARSGFKNGAASRGEALSQHVRGWAESPIPLNSDGRPTTWRPKRYDIASRFGVELAEKLRACDDLRRSLANLAFHVTTPNQLVSWGHISQISSLLNNWAGDWELFKADHGAARKQLLLDINEQDAAIISPRNPHDRLWYGFFSRSLVFGSIAAAISDPLQRIFAPDR